MKTLKNLLYLVSIRMRPDVEFTLVNSTGDRIRCFQSNYYSTDIVTWYYPQNKRPSSSSESFDRFPDNTLSDLGLDATSKDWRFADETFESCNAVIKECSLIIDEFKPYGVKHEND